MKTPREKALEKALRKLVRYIRENNVCDVDRFTTPTTVLQGVWMEKSGAWLALLDQADDALREHDA